MYGFDLGLRAEEFGDAMGVFSMCAHAIRKGLKSAQGQPALKRRRNGAAFMLEADDFFKEQAFFFSAGFLTPGFFSPSLFHTGLSPAVLPKDQCAHGHVTVARKIFGDRVHDYVDTKMQWLLQERSGPGVVAGDDGTAFFSERD